MCYGEQELKTNFGKGKFMTPFLEEIGRETFIRFRIWEIVSKDDFEPHRALGMTNETFREAVHFIFGPLYACQKFFVPCSRLWRGLNSKLAEQWSGYQSAAIQR